jgi:hypothetical protein
MPLSSVCVYVCVHPVCAKHGACQPTHQQCKARVCVCAHAQRTRVCVVCECPGPTLAHTSAARVGGWLKLKLESSLKLVHRSCVCAAGAAHAGRERRGCLGCGFVVTHGCVGSAFHCIHTQFLLVLHTHAHTHTPGWGGVWLTETHTLRVDHDPGPVYACFCGAQARVLSDVESTHLHTATHGYPITSAERWPRTPAVSYPIH